MTLKMIECFIEELERIKSLDSCDKISDFYSISAACAELLEDWGVYYDFSGKEVAKHSPYKKVKNAAYSLGNYIPSPWASKYEDAIISVAIPHLISILEDEIINLQKREQ